MEGLFPVYSIVCLTTEPPSAVTSRLLAEKVRLYVDDIVLYLSNLGPSPHMSLCIIINSDSYFTVFTINSQKAPQNLAYPLLWIETFTCLGITMIRDPKEFIPYKTEFLFKVLVKLLTWTKLHLLMIGRMNQFKIISLPQIPYLFSSIHCLHSIPH